MTVKRISLVFFIDGNELLARQIADAVQSFVKVNYGISENKMKTDVRTPMLQEKRRFD